MQKKAVVLIIVFILIIEFLIYSVYAEDKDMSYFYDRNDTASRMLAGASSVTGLYYPDSYNNKEKYDIIDVSEFQLDINWTAIRNAGIEAAIIRVGGRYYGSGGIYTDGKYATNLQGAKNAGLKVGAYFYSAAINENEAIQEANFAADLVDSTGVKLDLPLYIDFEGSGGNGNQRVENNVNQSMGTNILREFCNTVKSRGYKPGIYASYYFLGSYSYRDTVVSWKYNMWLAWYSNNALYNVPYNVDVWQYTGSGYVNGIGSQYVDRCILFIDKPGKCTNLNYTIDSSDSSKATLKWDYINGIDDYQIEITQGGRTTTQDVTIGGLILASNTMTAKVSLSDGTNKFRVRAVNKKYGFQEIGAWSDYVTTEYSEDRTGPQLSSLNVVSPNTGSYRSGQEIKIAAIFDENIYSNTNGGSITSSTAPRLKVKFSNSTIVKTATYSSSIAKMIIYSITIDNNDDGVLKIADFTGTVYDISGNSTNLSPKTLGGNTITAIKLKKGDVNGDENINIRDLIMIRKYIANSTKWNLTDSQKSRADTNGDGNVTIRDVIKLRKYIAADSNATIRAKHPDWIW